MKSVKEIQSLLVNALWNCLSKPLPIDTDVEYYNKMLGDASFLMAYLLGTLLNLRDDWDFKKWLDDSLITKLDLNKYKCSIWGVMIWGKKGTTEQWTEPFYFEVILDDKPNFKEYTFLFGDLNKPEISYEEFKTHRNYWEQTERDWKFIINRKK